jgi:alkylation response protein AidB-like acyl-CoA dehydrogenase
MMDRAGNKAAQGEIAMIKVAAPIMALKIIDDAIQAFGAAGVSEDAGLARSLCADPHAAARGRAGRGPSPRDRPAGV